MSDEHPEDFDAYEYAVKDGIVLSVLDARAVVRVDKDESECGGCRACAMRSLCRGKDIGQLDLPVVATAADGNARILKEGDRVRIAYRPANAALAALVMFVPALAGLLFGGLAGWRAGAGSGWADGILVLGCGAGFAAGVIVSFVLARVSPALRPKTKLLRKPPRDNLDGIAGEGVVDY